MNAHDLKNFIELTDDGSRTKHYAAVIRNYRIIKEFMKVEDISPELRKQFNDWLFGEANTLEKDIALEVIFNEMMKTTYSQV